MMNRKKNDNSAARESGKRRRLVPVVMLGILAAAAAIRITFLIQLSGTDLGEILPLDMRFYHDLGAALASGSGLPQGGLTFNPLYPFFLVIVFRIFGDGLLVPRIVQALAGILTIWLIFMSARLFTGYSV